MNRSTVDHSYQATRREHTLDVAYQPFTRALESLLGRMDIGALTEIASLGPEKGRERLASMVGPSGFALFQQIDHGGLLTALGGQPARATTYVFGNALIAIEMTKHAPVVGLYVPPRLYVRDRGSDGVIATFDLPSATFAQFGSAEVDAVARSLDEKIDDLIREAAERASRDHG